MTTEYLRRLCRAELDRLQEAAQQEIPSFTPGLCCAFMMFTLVMSLLLVIFVPSAHEWPLRQTSVRKTTVAPTTPAMLLYTDDDTTGDVFSKLNSTAFDDAQNTRVFQIYDR
ncbi:hypothetical protein MRX96_000326 [Rhipicephalus microplus]